MNVFNPPKLLGLSYKAALLISVVASPSISMADDILDNVTLRGFGTLSATYVDSDDIGFRRNITQTGDYRGWTMQPDTILGVQADVDITDKLSSTIQLVAKDRPHDTLNDAIEWAYLTYRLDNQWTFRAGRIGMDHLAMSEYGNVGYAYDWVRPPVEFYGAIPYSSFDGLDVAYRFPFAEGYLTSKVFAGYLDETLVTQSGNHEFTLSPFYGANLRYENNNLTLHGSIIHMEIDSYSNKQSERLHYLLSQYPLYPSAEINQRLELEGGNLDFISLGMKYRNGPWTYSGEVTYLDSDSPMYLPYVGMYAGVSRRINDWSLYSVVSHAYTTEKPQTSHTNELPFPLSFYTNTVLNWVDLDQTTLSLGARWDFTNNMALKAQWDRTWIQEDEAYLWRRRSDRTPDTSIDTLTFSLNFVF